MFRTPEKPKNTSAAYASIIFNLASCDYIKHFVRILFIARARTSHHYAAGVRFSAVPPAHVALPSCGRSGDLCVHLGHSARFVTMCPSGLKPDNLSEFLPHFQLFPDGVVVEQRLA